MIIIQDSRCSGCIKEKETPLHITQHFQEYIELRRRVLGAEKLTIGEVNYANYTNILAFIRGTGLRS